MFAAGGVTIDGSSQKPSRIVERPLLVVLDSLKLAASQALAVGPAEPEAIPLRVVLEDEHLLVVDKPAGMVVHAGPGHPRGTLVNALLHHLGVSADALPVLPGNDATRPGIVHRLDRDTSGLIVVARSAPAQEGLAAQFRSHTIRRRYLGVMCGAPALGSVTVRSFHGRDPNNRKRFSPEVNRGRVAITPVEVTRGLLDAALASFTLKTGRTHQIRMHALLLGHPIVGDPLYGPRLASARIRALVPKLGRHALHAETLGFRHPITGAEIDLQAPLPAELVALIAALEPEGGSLLPSGS